jgi:hypothetical protein
VNAELLGDEFYRKGPSINEPVLVRDRFRRRRRRRLGRGCRGEDAEQREAQGS